MGTQAIQQHRTLIRVECYPQRFQILRAQPARLGHLFNRFRTNNKGVAFFKRCRKIPGQRNLASHPHIQRHTLLNYQVIAASLREAGVELANSRNRFVGPIAGRSALGKSNSVRQQHGMLGNCLAGL